MPYTTTWKKRGVIWEMSGDCHIGEIAQMNMNFYNDTRSYNCKYQILDCLAVENVEVDENSLKMIAAVDAAGAKSYPTMQVAIVVDRPEWVPLADHCRNRYSQNNSGWTLRVFDTREGAEAWLMAKGVLEEA